MRAFVVVMFVALVVVGSLNPRTPDLSRSISHRSGVWVGGLSGVSLSDSRDVREVGGLGAGPASTGDVRGLSLLYGSRVRARARGVTTELPTNVEITEENSRPNCRPTPDEPPTVGGEA